MSDSRKPLTDEERDRLTAGRAAHEAWRNAGSGQPAPDWDRLSAYTRERWARAAEAASDEIAAHVNLEREARIQHLEELIAEILADFWPAERFDGIHEGLRDQQARVDDYRQRAGLEPQS